MRLVNIGVASVSVKVGDFSGNAERLRAVIAEAKFRDVHLLVTPELCISGYSLEDRIWWPDIARRSWESLEALQEHCNGISVFVGLPVRIDAMIYNAAALIHNGSIRGLILKKYLPTYSIFYEGRNWAAWHSGATTIHGVPAGELIFDLPFGKVSAEICEDLWSTNSPAHARVRAGAEIVCNPSASPFTPLKNEQRRRLILGAAGSLACVYAYSNLLGCDNSRLVFDGGGMIASPEGIVAEGVILSPEYWTLTTGVVNLDDVSRVRSENTTWRQEAARQAENPAIMTVDARDGEYAPASVKAFADQFSPNLFMPGEARTVNDADRYLEELFNALVLGLRDYYEKVGAFKQFLIALSGGRDSALCLLLAVHAAKLLNEGKDAGRFGECVSTVYLPNKAYSSSATQKAARALAKELGVSFRVVAIDKEAKVALEKAAELMDGEGHVTPLARQNLQARVRGNMMLNWANNAQGLLLVTSNLSEAAVGYTTTGGDNQGGYSPIANVPKTLVTMLLEYVAKRDGLKSLQQILDIPPSAELAPDQKDEADLMPYVVLDDLLYLFARRRMSLPDCWRILVHRHPDRDAEQLRAWTAHFGRLFAFNQWKREQLPVTMKVLDLDLDPKTGFRFPVTQSIQDELDELASATL
ncbi:MAG: NAD(+) synthase [Candidatus Hydrogenedentes bacterium]|nr:NAD(+) synthase [Candidatus Hydrogenedentota bacterium]